MKNSNNTPVKGKRENQIMFIEYEKPTKEGHLITIVDSYHNTLGRIHRNYNEGTKKYEFLAYDHAGKPLNQTSDKVWEVKKHFTDNRTQLLEDAHQRRIESKEASRSNAEKGSDKPSEKKDIAIQDKQKTGISKESNSKESTDKSKNHYDFDQDEEDFKELEHEGELEDRDSDLDSLRENQPERDGREFNR